MGPPKPDILRGIFWRGYRDAAAWFRTEPKDSDQCGCRRAAGREMNGGEVARWRAARDFIQSGSLESLPEVDSLTGENVQELIARAEAFASRQLYFVRCAFGALLAVVTAVLLNADPVACAWF